MSKLIERVEIVISRERRLVRVEVARASSLATRAMTSMVRRLTSGMSAQRRRGSA